MSEQPRMHRRFRAVGGADVAPAAKAGDVVHVGKLSLHVVSEEDAERASMVVCIGISAPLACADNLVGPCTDCGDMLQWRPSAPKAPPRVCMNCALIRTLKAGRDG